MFGSDVIKDYYVILFWFKPDCDRYLIYKYQRNRKLSVNQMWDMVRNKKYECSLIGSGTAHSINDYGRIIDNLELAENRCHMLINFDM